MPSQNQISVGLRYLGTFGAGIASVSIAFGQLTPDQAHAALAAWQQVLDSLNNLTAGIFKLATILGPVIGGWLALIGVKKSGFGEQLKSVFMQAAASGANVTEEKKAVMDATASLDGVKKVVPVDPQVAREIPNPKVTSQ